MFVKPSYRKYLDSSEERNGFWFALKAEPDTTFLFKNNMLHIVLETEYQFVSEAYSVEEAIDVARNTI